MFGSKRDVVRCLIMYSDWWQPTTTSVIPVGSARRSDDLSQGIRPGLIETFEERLELCRRMQQIADRDRYLLFLWYVKQLHVDDIAAEVGISRRQCFRRRSGAIEKLLDGP